eukprot:15270141-Alexandrium_andersonii.AAC.1
MGPAELDRELYVDPRFPEAAPHLVFAHARAMFRLREHQSVQRGLPMSKNGRRAPNSRMARSQSSGLLKSHEPPSGPGRTSKAPAGKTPNLGLRAVAAVA